MNQRRAILALKIVLWLSALTPFTWIVVGLFRDGLGANPTEKMTHVTGMTTLVLLLVTLSVSPIRRFTGWNPVIRLRRPLGLFAFFYASVHFTIWFVFYNVVNVQYMIEGHRRATLHHGRLQRVLRRADSPRGHVYEGLDPAFGKEVDQAPHGDLHGGNPRRRPLLLAGQSRHSAAAAAGRVSRRAPDSANSARHRRPGEASA